MSDTPTPVSAPEESNKQLLDEVFGLGDSAPLSWVDEARSANDPVPLGMLGPYELLAEIGRGGQGSVYKAVQPGTGRIVAIKRMRTELLLHDRARERFRREVDAVTRLNHPSIVTVHSAEVIEGNSILVMEYVRGISIDRWSDNERQNSGERMPISDILNVFAQVCDAVAHAHQRGVIHRDIKPSNILIDTDDAPHVLDFGIARLAEGWQDGSMEARTTIGFAGTPSYAPPEQINGSSPYANTLGDVYSLGILLFRLLTGAEAFAASTLTELLDAVRSGSPPRPSQQLASLPRELDWIVLKAIDVEPARRYQTLEAFADDVRRFLNGQPISAHPPSAWYKIKKFIKRHTVGVWIGAVTVVVVIGLIALGVAQGFHIASQNVLLGKSLESEKILRTKADDAAKLAGEREKAAKDEAEAHRLTVAFLSEMIQTIGTLGEDTAFVPIPALYEWADQRLDGGALETRPGVELAIRQLLASLANRLNRFDDVVEHLRAAASLSERLYGPDNKPTLQVLQQLGDALLFAGMPEASIETFRKSFGPAQKAFGDRSYQVAEILQRQSRAHRALQQYDQANDLCSEALAIYMDDLPKYRHRAGSMLRRIGASHAALGDLDLADKYLNEAWEMLGGDAPTEDPKILRQRADLMWIMSNVCYVRGQFEEALPLIDRSTALFKAHLSPTHTAINNTLVGRARVLRRLGRFEECESVCRTIVEDQLKRQKQDGLGLAQRRFDLGVALLALKREVEARDAFALAIARGDITKVDPNELSAKVDRVIVALVQCGFAVDDSPCLYTALDDLAWLLELVKYPGPASFWPD